MLVSRVKNIPRLVGRGGKKGEVPFSGLMKSLMFLLKQQNLCARTPIPPSSP